MTGFLDPLTLAQEDDPLAPGATGNDDQPAPAPATTGELDHPAPVDPELEQVRQLVLRAHPDVVPELVAGASIAELLASIGPAAETYSALAARIGAAAPQVPAGTVSPAPVDLERLPIAEKLRRGLAERKQ
jgi:hypothetical protein